MRHHFFHGLGGGLESCFAGGYFSGLFGFLLNVMGFLGHLDFVTEFIYSAGSVHVFHFSGEEGMAGSTDFHLDFGFRRSGGKSVAACADDLGVVVVSRVDGCFHI